MKNQTVLIVVQLCVLLSLVIVSPHSHTSVVNAFNLPNNELTSAIWLIENYGLGTPQDSSICNYTLWGMSNPVFICDDTIDTFSHITIINIEVFAAGTGNPDANLNDFIFPYLTSFTVNIIDLSSNKTSYNILSKFNNNVPLLQSISINDGALTSIPTTFGVGLTSLTYFDTQNSPVTSVGNLLNGTDVTEIRIMYPLPAFLNKNANIYLRKLEKLLIVLNGTHDQEIQFSPTSYPKLGAFMLTSYSLFKIVINAQTPSIHTIALYASLGVSPNYNLNVSYPESLAKLTINGISSSLSPALEQFTNLTYLEYFAANLTSYPFSQFPPKLTELNLQTNNFVTLPSNMNFPPQLTTFGFSYNYLTSIPWSVFDNVKQPVIDFSYNPQLSGSIPQSMCKAQLSIVNTAFINTEVPDCFWCFVNVPRVIDTNLTPPQDFHCSIFVNNGSRSEPLVFGKATLYGTNLGYGRKNETLEIVPIIPNSLLTLQILNRPYSDFYTSTPFSFTLSDFYPYYAYDFTFVEVGIKISSVRAMAYNGTSVRIIITCPVYNTNLNHSISVNSSSCELLGFTPNNEVICVLLNSTLGTTLTTPVNITMSNTNYQTSGLFPITFTYDYPRISSASFSTFDTNSSVMFYLYGFYGNTFSNATVLINNTIVCSITNINSQMISCLIPSLNNNYGSASVFISIDGYTYNRPNVIYIPPPVTNPSNNTTTTGGSGPTPKEQCETNTHNCYGNGECQDNGQCKCNPGYSQLDNCLTKYFNGSIPIEANQTSPVTRFNIDGVEFRFEMYAIQELSLDLSEGTTENVTTTIFTEKWISNITTQGSLTTANYVLDSNDTNANVTATISFSSEPRQVTFGDKLIDIDPNSIKVTVSIDNWAYQSNIATLRVLFRTIFNNNQGIGVGCDDQLNINTISYDSFGTTIQYLRVVKDNIQFTGRFMDYVVSDGRSTYSQTQLVSLIPLNNTSDESMALIAINFPQCQQCLLDPDFTPLIIDNSKVNSCSNDDSSKTWKIAVGVSVGGVAFIALVIGAALYLKDSNAFRFKMSSTKSVLLKRFRAQY